MVNSAYTLEPLLPQDRKLVVKSLNLLGLLLSASLVVDNAFAQSDYSIEEIVVIAEAREENSQIVPVSITAFSAKDIVEAGIQTTADFVALTPNLTFDDSFSIGNSFVSVRGVTQINNADSPVAIVVDGVPQNNQKQFKMDLYDVERIEVLRGPQGALYGRNAIGGAINIITRQPSDFVEGFLQLGLANEESTSVSAALGGPIIKDKLLFRASGSYKDSDGLITNSFLGQKVDFYEASDVRMKLGWIATDRLKLDLRFSRSNLDGGAIYDVGFWNNSGPQNTNTERDPVTDILGTSERDTQEITLKVDWATSRGTFNYILNRTRIDESYHGDLDFCNPIDCPAGFFGLGQLDNMQDLTVELTSHEIRFVSLDDRRFRWIAGGYYIGTDRKLESLATLVDLGNFPIVSSVEDNENQAYSYFGQFEYDLTEKLEVSLSIRYDKDKRRQKDVGAGTSRKTDFDAWQPKITLTWDVVDGQIMYATYASGFRSGGFNGIGGRKFDDEIVDSFEVGYKSILLDGRLLLNASVFNSRSTDFQFFFVDLNAGGAQVIDNLKEVELRGFELETKFLLSSNWSVFSSLGILDSDIKKIDPNLGVPARTGNRAPKTTESTLNIGSQIRFPLGSLEGLARIDLERRGDKYWHPDNIDVMDPVFLVNLRATVEGKNWTLSFWAKNLNNEFYYEDFNAVPFTGLPWNIGFPAKPRSYGVDVRYLFSRGV
jgi:iron complex outermembrane recepter protein